MEIDPNNIIVSADEILPGLWLGNEAASQSASFMKKHKIGLIVNATKHIPSKFLGKIHYIRVPVNDPGIHSGDNEDVDIMRISLPLVLAYIYKFRRAGKNVLVHCHAGAQRSAIIVAAYLLFRKHAKNINDAINQVIKHRGIAFFGGSSVNFRRALTG
jgi:predicted protein tyrosine phosphatase